MDLVAVGPGGVFIVDTKARINVTDELDNLADLVRFTEQALAEVGLAPNEVRALARRRERHLNRARWNNDALTTSKLITAGCAITASRICQSAYLSLAQDML